MLTLLASPLSHVMYSQGLSLLPTRRPALFCSSPQSMHTQTTKPLAPAFLFVHLQAFQVFREREFQEGLIHSHPSAGWVGLKLGCGHIGWGGYGNWVMVVSVAGLLLCQVLFQIRHLFHHSPM